jgi:hypothetical protein
MSASSRIRDGDEGVHIDLSLIDSLLALSPEQRLRQNDRMLKTIQDLRDGFTARGTDDASLGTRGERR